MFEGAHRLVFRLLQERAIAGFRIDHVDGLYDPRDYLRRLQARAASWAGSGRSAAVPGGREDPAQPTSRCPTTGPSMARPGTSSPTR